MNRPNTRLRYVHINSRDRLGQNDANDLADLKIHFHQPIKNALRCCVKQFSIANHMFNIRSGENKLTWVEYYAPSGSTYAQKEFQIQIPVGWYNVADLCNEINNQIVAMTGHVVTLDGNETPLQITFSQELSSFRIKIALNGGLNDKWFSPVLKKGSIWKHLGFTDNQMFHDEKLFDLVADILEVGRQLDYGTQDDYDYVFEAGQSSNTFEYKGTLPATIESPHGLFITSDALTSGDTYESRVNPNGLYLEAVPSRILHFVQFNSGRYSYVHYDASSQSHWNHLNNTSLHDIDIQLRSENGTILSHKECGEYNLVLTFECLVEPEFSSEAIEAYNTEAYRKEHVPQRFTLK